MTPIKENFMCKLFFSLVAALTILFGFLSTLKAEILGDYLGVTACVECHEDVVAGWKTTPHAHAFETLKEQGEEKQSAQGCVKCHVVAFEKDGGFIDMALTPELKDVQCEACHGPGRKHAESEEPEGILLEKPDAALCRTCHTEGQDKNFDYDTKKMWVHGGGKEVKIAATADATGGNLHISQTSLAFGDMVEGDVAKKTVMLTNKGDGPLTVTNVTTS
jgi:predicted CXXCH cytochrome family protein